LIFRILLKKTRLIQHLNVRYKFRCGIENKNTFGILLFLFVSSLLTVSACNSTLNPEYKLQYKPAPPISLSGIAKPDSLFVANIVDKRSKEEKITFEPDADPLILIPLWWYSHSDLNPVIRFSYFQPSLIDVLNKLFVVDINAAGIFKQVLNSPKGIEQIKFEKKLFSINPNTYKLVIILEKAVWSRNLTAYGLSYPGTFLWALGLPVSYGNVYFSIKAVLHAPGNKIIGKKQISEQIPCTEWIYDQINYQPPISEFKLAKIFPKVTKELREFIFQTIKKYQIEKKYGSLKNNPIMEKAENPKL